jgi:50S ribosomal subunit-associated GTPase HflX
MSMPMLVVANKVDAMSAGEAAQALQRLKLATNLPIVPVSAQQHLGLMRLKQSLELLAGSPADA